MGKKNKHSKDKLHKTVSELRSHHVDDRELELSELQRRLKFDSCCLALNTLNDKPVGLTDDDNYCYVFNCNLIVKFLEKFQLHPVTGKKVTAINLIELKYHKNDEDKYHCPVIYKLFNQHSKIVANKKTGHVYSYEAYQQLNLKPKNFRDLLTDEPFEVDDIVTIQDPSKASEKWNVSEFYYIKNKLKIDDDQHAGTIRDVGQSSILKSSLEEYKKQADTIVKTFNKIVGQDEVEVAQPKLDKINSATYSDGAVARSVTSTVAQVATKQNPALLKQDQILYPKVKKKGYVQLVTNMGPINLELFCDRTPITCHNFLLLATRGYYDDTIFHRLIKNFIVQGGDPTGTGSGGQSAWGTPFKDECHSDLKHSGRGVVAMANSGPNTNKSQFYITLRGTWDHLDGKHTVFGRVVGGDETLDRIEAVEVDKKDKPKKEIKILKIIKYLDPYEEIEKALEEERAKELDSGERVTTKRPLKKFRSGIGAYINLESLQKNDHESGHNEPEEARGMSLSSQLARIGPGRGHNKTAYGDFSSW